MKVAFLIPNNRPLTLEELRAWDFLSKAQGIIARKMTFSQLAAKPALLESYDVAWWHCDGDYLEAKQITPNLVDAFKMHVAQGHGLFLSLLACQFATDLGLEVVAPNTVVHDQWSETSWAKDYPDIRGFACFNHHPVFEGFLGGLYAWVPRIGVPYSACYYQDTLPISGRVVAVEKLYIKLNEQRRMIMEYEVGSGRILTVGSYLYFADESQRFRVHLEKFTLNCLDCLGKRKKHRANLAQADKGYWNFETPSVSPFEHSSKTLGRTALSLLPISSGLEINRDLSPMADEEQFFDLTGRRMLVMGMERGGITEIWSHPTRIFKHVRSAFKVGDGEWHWSSNLSPTITVRPESLTRRYELEDATIKETLYASLQSPAAVLHYEVDSRRLVQIVVAAQTDLRLMWPLSEQVTGSLRFAWDPGIHSAVITDSTGKNAALFGSSCVPAEHLVGQFSQIKLENDRIVGVPTNEIQASSAIRASLKGKTRQCAFVFAGSGFSMQEAVRSYRSALKRIPKLLAEQARHYNRLLDTTVQFVTPDAEFNKSYRWSVVGTDKMFAETPGLGSSFLAGIGLSTSGWDGGQAVSGRPGYAWYFGRDSAWTCMAALDYGDFEKVRAVLEFLGDHQDISGKILHELTTSGHSHFDAADSTPLYLIVFGKYLRMSGDVSFARKELRRIKDAVAYCRRTDTDDDHLIENTNSGHGWIEGGRLFPAYTEHYLASCWAQALTEAAYIAKAVNERRLMSSCKREADAVRTIVKKDFRNDKTGFYNFAKNGDGSFRSEKTVLPTVGMYFDCVEEDFSQRSLSEYASDNFSADWGVRIVGKDDPLFEPTGYHYGSIWPLFTGWTSLAEFHLHRPLQGFAHLLSNVLLYDQFSAGCVEEVLHGIRFEPAGVCPHQAWSGTMILQPALEGMLGLKTDARASSIELRPYLPPQWKKFEVGNIRLGDCRVTVRVRRSTNETTFSFSVSSASGRKHWRAVQLTLQPVFPLGTQLHGICIDGKQEGRGRTVDNYQSCPTIRATMKSQLEVRFEHSHGVSVVLPRPHFLSGEESKGLRIVGEEWSQDSYVLTIEGKAEEEYLLDVFDPSGSVKSVDGAVALARDGEYLTLSVSFLKSTVTGYARKEVKLSR